MGSKSLPSFKHSSVGTKTHKARTATAHVCYIMRAEARTHFQAENMPDGSRGTRVFFDKLWEKAGMPENARICDKLMIALPNELTPEQRYETVQTFMQELGQGRIAWCAAYHEKGEDAHNPHAHIVFKDADINTGRKVIGTTTSAKDVREAQEHRWKVPPRATTDDMRKRWCDHLNKVMERAGLDIRYDARTLKEQGIDREPQIPIGPKAQTLEEKSHNFDSHDRSRGDRTIAYSLLDQMSRVQYNNQIIEANREKEQAEMTRTYQAREPLPLSPLSRLKQEQHNLLKAQAATRQALYEEQKRDREALRNAQKVGKLDHRTWGNRLYAGARQVAYDQINKQYAGKWKDLRDNTPLSKRNEGAAALKAEQKEAYAAEAKRQVDLRRPEKDAAWKALKESQEKERLALKAEHRKETSVLARQQVADRLAVEEKIRAEALDKKAQCTSKGLSSRQDMATVQRVAVETMKLHARTNWIAGRALPANPLQAANAYQDIARAEEAKLPGLRAALNEMRSKNLERAGPSAFVEKMLSSNGQRAPWSVGRTTSRKQDPRQIILPGILDYKNKRVSAHQQAVRQANQAQDIARQAMTAGRTLTDAERTNAPPEIRQRLSDRERKALAIRHLTERSPRREERGKGRSGGGRGR